LLGTTVGATGGPAKALVAIPRSKDRCAWREQAYDPLPSFEPAPPPPALQRLLTVAAGRRTHAPCHQAVIQISARCSPDWLLSEALRLSDSHVGFHTSPPRGVREPARSASCACRPDSRLPARRCRSTGCSVLNKREPRILTRHR
jgi:hypothetical protein